MARQHIYTVLRGINVATGAEQWTVVKMERDWEIVECYVVGRVTFESQGKEHVMMTCTCFAGNKDTCRHRQMLTIFEEAEAIGSRKSYDFDKGAWIDPPKAALEVL